MTLTQNRYYSNLSQGSFVTTPGGLPIGETLMQVQANSHWPSSFPFAVRIEPGSANEEVVLVTAGSGTAGSPYVVTRGFDGTTQLNHSQGAAVIPGFCQLDLAEPQQHINMTASNSGAHGLPSSAWGGGTVQLIKSMDYTQATGTDFAFSGIPTNFNTLRLVYNLQGNGTTTGGFGSNATWADPLVLTFNNNHSSVYDGVSSYTTNNTTSGCITGSGTGINFWCGAVWTQFFATPGMGSGWIELPGYANNAQVKQGTFSCIASDNRGAIMNLWGCGGTSLTAAVNSLKVSVSGSSNGFTAGSIQLYGIV